MHTPGMWSLTSPPDGSPKYVGFTIRGNGEDDAGLWQIADVIRGPALLDGTDCLEGNARLIAAAPALLAACKEAQHVLGDLAAELCEHPDYRNYFSSGHGLKVYGDLAAAIALAENSADCS